MISLEFGLNLQGFSVVVLFIPILINLSNLMVVNACRVFVDFCGKFVGFLVKCQGHQFMMKVKS